MADLLQGGMRSIRALVDGAGGETALVKAVHVGLVGYLALKFLEESLDKSPMSSWLIFWRRNKERKKVIVWIDGCWDMTHFGHFNAFRQAKALGDYLIVGLNPDREVIRYKGGAPLMREEERLQSIRACKWVDEVVEDVPYVLNKEYLNDVVFGKYKVDYVVHGDDPCLDADGNDVFATSKAAGKYKEIKRTEGVSTTDLVGRMLMMTRDHFDRSPATSPVPERTGSSGGFKKSLSFRAGFAGFLPTTRRIAEFSAPNKRPSPTDRVVYADGAFDLLLPCHIAFLEKARKLGDFLIVGVHRDEEVNKYKGSNYPIMNLQERVLGALSCMYVDEVVIGAPWEITEDMIKTFNISVVVHGNKYDKTSGGMQDYNDGYRVPKAMGIFREVDSGSAAGVGDIIQRVMKNRMEFEAKHAKKSAQEQTYYSNKKYVQEA